MAMDLHLPNATRPFTDLEMNRVLEAQPSTLVHLVYGRGVVPEARGQIAQLVRQTRARLILRPYDRQIITRWEPENWGRECARRVEEYLPVCADITAVLDNEPNLPEEGGITDPWHLWTFWTEAAAGFRGVLGRRVKLALPPLAPVGEYLDIYRWILGWEPAGHFERVALHVYARTGNWGEVARMRSATGLPVDVTEWDSWTPQGYLPLGECLRRLEGAEAACWFILNSDSSEFDAFNLMKHWEEIMNVNIPELDELVKRLELLEKQGSMRDDVLVLMLQGRWQEAEDLLKALMGGEDNPANGTWSAVSFPKA